MTAARLHWVKVLLVSNMLVGRYAALLEEDAVFPLEDGLCVIKSGNFAAWHAEK